MTESLENHHVSIPTTELGRSMAAKLRREEWTDYINPPTIFMVPNSLRQGDADAYEPKLISIGPLHRNSKKPELNHMESVKWMYLKDFVRRDPANDVETYIDIVGKEKARARKQYSSNITVDDAEFEEMLVLDGCFIIEFFMKYFLKEVSNPWSNKWSPPILRSDLLLMENQIPFFILDILFKKSHIVLPQVQHPTFTMLACHYLKANPPSRHQEIHHLLHLNYLCQFQSFIDTINGNEQTQRPTSSTRTLYFRSAKRCICGPLVGLFYFLVSWVLMCKRPRHQSSKMRIGNKAPRALPSAKKLTEAGVKFKRKEEDTNNKCCLNVSFDEEEGTLEIPFFPLQQNTISWFRNFIAFEQCCPGLDRTHLTAYATFMDKIIDTAEDVAILVRHGIIESKLGADEDVAKLFNNICKGASLDYDNHYLVHLFKAVDRYCASDRHRWRAALANRYFYNPWAVVSFILAIILLLLTVGGTTATIYQTVYTVKSYKKEFDGASLPQP